MSPPQVFIRRLVAGETGGAPRPTAASAPPLTDRSATAAVVVDAALAHRRPLTLDALRALAPRVAACREFRADKCTSCCGLAAYVTALFDYSLAFWGGALALDPPPPPTAALMDAPAAAAPASPAAAAAAVSAPNDAHVSPSVTTCADAPLTPAATDALTRKGSATTLGGQSEGYDFEVGEATMCHTRSTSLNNYE